MRRSTASTPASATSPRRASPSAIWRALQVNLLRSHAAGVGEPLPVRAVRAMMALRANVLAKGFSGIRLDTLDALLALLNRGVHPLRAQPRIGRRERRPGAAGPPGARPDRRRRDVGRTAASAGARRRSPRPAWRRSRSGRRKASRSSTARRRPPPCWRWRWPAPSGWRAPPTSPPRSVDRRAARLDATRSIRASTRRGRSPARRPRPPISGGSSTGSAHQRVARQLRPGAGRLLDALRAAGARRGARSAGAWSATSSTIEMNAATDNPMVFADDRRHRLGRQLPRRAGRARRRSAGASRVTQLATISERRSERLVNPALSGLPAFLTRHGGLQSGLMMAQVTAAALTSEMKTLAHPASVDTIPTSANKEDHVSMSMARRAQGRARACNSRARARRRAAVRVPGDRPAARRSPARRRSCACMRAVRDAVPTLDDDRPPSPDIEAIAELIVAARSSTRSGIVVN